MRKIYPFLPLFSIVLLVIILARGLQLNPKDIPSAAIGKPLPKVQSLDKMAHQIYLLHFWATWCDSCAFESLILNQIDVPIVGVLYKDTSIHLKKWLNTHHNPYELLLKDPKGRFGFDMGVVATPETFLIDEEGIIRYRYQGPLTEDILRSEIYPLMQKLKRVSQP